MRDPVKKSMVLIVDDMPNNIRTLAEILSDEYQVLVATNGPDALNIIASEEIAVVLLDVMMPEMDGYEVCKRIKGSPTGRTIPVIFVTALNEKLDEAHALSLGGIDFITKPVHAAVVRARVRNHLAMAEMMRTLELQKTQLEESSSFKEEVTHIYQTDLRGPLDHIVSMINMLAWNTNLTKQQEELVLPILRYTYKLSNLINFSIELHKISRGQYLCKLTHFDILALVDDFKIIEGDFLKKKDFSITILLDNVPRQESSVFKVQGDVRLCYSVINAILMNISSASDPGDGVKISLGSIDRDGSRLASVQFHTQRIIVSQATEPSQKKLPLGKKDEMRWEYDLYAASRMMSIQHGHLMIETSSETGTVITLIFPLPS
ncbi:MAG: response regulator [Magnetococcales bacterium]|nr:response regulator [Magnetococcales bacterium]